MVVQQKMRFVVVPRPARVVEWAAAEELWGEGVVCPVLYSLCWPPSHHRKSAMRSRPMWAGARLCVGAWDEP